VTQLLEGRRPRKKADYTAAILVKDGEVTRATELGEVGIAATSRFSVHLARVCLKSPHQLLKPCMANAKSPSPSKQDLF
jgi:hypothetical protein